MLRVWHITVKRNNITVIMKERDGKWLIDVKKNGKLEHTEGPFKDEPTATGQAFILIERMRGEGRP